MSHSSPSKPEPHSGVAGLAISAMGLVMALVLDRLGVLGTMDAALANWVSGIGLDGELRSLDAWMPWTWAMVMTIGLCQAVLHVRGSWRRIVITVVTLVLTLSWVPVLALASYLPPVSGSLVALIWVGVGSLIYAQRHREPD